MPNMPSDEGTNIIRLPFNVLVYYLYTKNLKNCYFKLNFFKSYEFFKSYDKSLKAAKILLSKLIE